MSSQEFINLLQDNGFIKSGDYTLKSGVKSNFYIDLRDMGSSKDVRKCFLKLMKPLIPTEDDSVALIGVPDGATPLAAYLAQHFDMYQLRISKQVKNYGHALQTRYYQRHKIILIEDVVSSGSSLIDIITRLQEYGANIIKVMPIIDRNLGARDKITKEFPHLKYEPVINLHEMEHLIKDLPSS